MTGLPLAPVAQRLVSADGSYTTYSGTASPSPAKNHLEELSDCIGHLDRQGFPKPLVHLIDREGDSVGHIRCWDAVGSCWLVRAKDNPKVDYAGTPTACKAVAADLAFNKTRQVSYQGKTYWQWVAQVEVTLSRPAKPSHLCPWVKERHTTRCPRRSGAGNVGGQPRPGRGRRRVGAMAV